MRLRLNFLIAFLVFAQIAFSQSDPWQSPDWVRGATIYEVNVRQYTKAGTWKALEKELPRLHRTGILVLWLMPGQYGTEEELKHLVKTAHNVGFKVIVEAPAQVPAMKSLLKNIDVDGFHCDVAATPSLDFWKQARIELDKTKRVFMFANGSGQEFHRNGFDATTGKEYFNLCTKIARGEKTGADLYGYCNSVKAKYKPADNIVYYTSNDIENSENGTEYERLGKAAVKTFAALSATLPGIPLLYTGQEAALQNRLSATEKDSIDWVMYPLEIFYSKLLDHKQHSYSQWMDSENPGKVDFLQDGRYPSLFVFIRKKSGKRTLFMANLSDKPLDATLVLGEIEGHYTDLITDKGKDIIKGEMQRFGPWGYVVLVQ